MLDFGTRQLDALGHLGPPTDICLVAAERTFLDRCHQDTSPQIVQMILRGTLIPHWYYRSDQWIDQPYLIMSEFIQPYRGPANGAYPWLYGDGTYQVDEDMTRHLLAQSQGKDLFRPMG